MFRNQEDVIKQDQAIKVAETSSGVIGSLSVAANFTMNSGSSYLQLFKSTASLVILPAIAITSVFESIFAWVNLYRAKNKSHPMLYALVQTAAAGAIIAAVVGTIVAPMLFMMAAPIINTAVFAAKTLFSFGSFIYFKVKAMKEGNDGLRSEYNEKAKNALIGSLIGLVATAAVVGVFLLGKTFLAALGIAAGVTSAIFAGGALFSAVKKYREPKVENKTPAVNEFRPIVIHSPRPELRGTANVVKNEVGSVSKLGVMSLRRSVSLADLNTESLAYKHNRL